MKAIVLTLTLAVSLSATGTRADTLTFTIAPATQGLTLEQASPPPGGGTTMTAADLSAAMEKLTARLPKPRFFFAAEHTNSPGR